MTEDVRRRNGASYTMVDRLCSQADPEAWFPEKGGSTREAKNICARCDDKVACLIYALDRAEPFGVWGGTSERDRKTLLRSVWRGQDGNPFVQLLLAIQWAGMPTSALTGLVRSLNRGRTDDEVDDDADAPAALAA